MSCQLQYQIFDTIIVEFEVIIFIFMVFQLFRAVRAGGREVSGRLYAHMPRDSFIKLSGELQFL
jgi:hypothetical protein